MAREMRDGGLEADRIAGVVLGSVPLAAALSLETGIPYVMVRKEKKDHGTSRLIEGDLDLGDRVLVVEDVITTAGSSMAAIGTLRESGAIVSDLISVIDREGGGRESLAGIGVGLRSLAKGSELAGGRR
jgi:orotate phosphoribosyltransferase